MSFSDRFAIQNPGTKRAHNCFVHKPNVPTPIRKEHRPGRLCHLKHVLNQGLTGPRLNQSRLRDLWLCWKLSCPHVARRRSARVKRPVTARPPQVPAVVLRERAGARSGASAGCASRPPPASCRGGGQGPMERRNDAVIRRGTNGVSTNGVTANFMFFDRGTFGVLPLTYLYLPKSARAYLFPICRNSLLLQRPR